MTEMYSERQQGLTWLTTGARFSDVATLSRCAGQTGCPPWCLSSTLRKLVGGVPVR